MKLWALIVAGLYVLILAVLTVPFILAAFTSKVSVEAAAESYTHWQYWLWLAVMGISQFALLLVPVRVASRRPTTRAALWPTLLAAGLMAGGLGTGAAYSVLEYFARGEPIPVQVQFLPLTVGLLVWCTWALVFARTRSETPDWISRQCRLLLEGSILELLIAVPTHIVARSRDYCCAGLMTFVGLTMGISVMLFSFGPAVLFLYAERWGRLHPKPQEPTAEGRCSSPRRLPH